LISPLPETQALLFGRLWKSVITKELAKPYSILGDVITLLQNRMEKLVEFVKAMRLAKTWKGLKFRKWRDIVSGIHKIIFILVIQFGIASGFKDPLRGTPESRILFSRWCRIFRKTFIYPFHFSEIKTQALF